MRVFLALATQCLAGCFVVDSVSTPYGEERPTAGFLEAKPHDGSPTPPRCKADGAFLRREDFYSHAGTTAFGVRLLPDESVAYGTVLVENEWTLARLEPGKPPAPSDFTFGRGAGYPAITGDGTTVFFARRAGDIEVSRRGSAASVFEKAAAVRAIVTAEQETTPYVTPDGSALYFSRLDAGRWVMLRIALPAIGQGETGVFTGASAPPGDNLYPVVTPDERTLFFAARNVQGDLDIWTATQPKKGAGFRDAHPIAELRTSEDDVPSWISPDACVLYYERWASKTSSKVMRAFREPLAP